MCKNDNQFILDILRPAKGLLFAKNTLNVEVQIRYQKGHFNDKISFPLIACINFIYIAIDDKVIGVATLADKEKLLFTAKIELKDFPDGPHVLKALFFRDPTHVTVEINDSTPVQFIVDRTPPSIRSVFPSNIVKIEDSDISYVVVETADAHSGIDLNRCFAFLDDAPCQKPSEEDKNLVFPTGIDLRKGCEKIKVLLTDLSGNKFESDFSPSSWKFPDFASSFIIEAEDLLSGIDVDNCTLLIDSKFTQKPTIHGKSLVFTLAKELEPGFHDISANIFDRSGNKAEYKTKFNMDNAKAVNSDVIVQTEKPFSSFNFDNCSISIDGGPQHKPSIQRRAINFHIANVFGNLKEGEHKLKVLISDAAGNTSKYESDFVIDKSAPVIHSFFPAKGSFVNEHIINNIVIKADDKYSGLDRFRCSVFVDNREYGMPALKKEGLVFHCKDEFNEGAHDLRIVLYDRAGNKTEHKSSFSIDTKPPVISSVFPDKGAVIDGEGFSKIVIEAVDNHSGIDLKNSIFSIDNQTLSGVIENNGILTLPVNTKFKDGAHSIIIYLSDNAGNTIEYKSEFLVKTKGKLAVSSLFPSNGVCVNKDGLKSMVVELEDAETGIDIEKCKVTINGKIIQNPIRQNKLLVFPVEGIIEDGSYKINVVLYDTCGNKIEHVSEFSILSMSDSEKPDDEETIDVKQPDKIKEELEKNPLFMKKWLMNSRETVLHAGLPYISEMARFIPHTFPEEQTDFALKFLSEDFGNTLCSFLERESGTPKKGIPDKLKKFENKSETNNEKLLGISADIISLILQDPVNMLEEMGVALTEEDKKAIFPPFNKENADELAEWIFMVQR